MRQDAFRDFRADEHITDSAVIAQKVTYRATNTPGWQQARYLSVFPTGVNCEAAVWRS